MNNAQPWYRFILVLVLYWKDFQMCLCVYTDMKIEEFVLSAFISLSYGAETWATAGALYNISFLNSKYLEI